MHLTPDQSATLTAVAAIGWPLVQAALDKPWWTAARRRTLALVAVVVIAAGTYLAGAYPSGAEAVTNHALAVAGLVLGAFNILKAIKINGVSVLDWAGLVTPGGVDLVKGRHVA